MSEPIDKYKRRYKIPTTKCPLTEKLLKAFREMFEQQARRLIRS